MFSTVEKQKRDYILLQVTKCLEDFSQEKKSIERNGFRKMCILVFMYVNINHERERERGGGGECYKYVSDLY